MSVENGVCIKNDMEVMKNSTYYLVRTVSAFAMLVLICIAASCVHSKQTVSSLHPYIAEIVGDTSLTENHSLSSFHLKRSGAVYVVGKPVDCHRVAEALSAADYFDNIDASTVPDRLADFGGETIVTIEDHTYGYAEELLLWRERCLRVVVDAIDSLCYANPYTSEKTVAKIPCKLLVLASPEFGLAKADIDTLFSIFNIDLKVISAASELSSYAVSKQGKSATLALAAHRPSLYECNASFVDSLSTSLPDLLSAYHESGEDIAPLDALLVEDDSLAVSMRSELQDILRGEGLDYEIYRSVISDRFEIVSKEQALSSAAYLSLRKDGLFTHRAAAPVSAKYLMVPELVYPDLSDWRIISYTEKHSCVEHGGI